MTDIAIVGMAALFPGAPDLGTFWHNIVHRVDSVTDVPATRWDPSYYDPAAWSQPASDKFYCRRGGFIDDIATFDPAAFGIMPVAVEGTEPDQLLALKVAAAAVADAGGEHRLGDRGRTGVILGRGGYLSAGVARLDQRVRAGRQLIASLRQLVPGLSEEQLDRVGRDFQGRLGPEQPEASIGLVPNLAASRIANRLDLKGPAYTVDAACASSLLAVDHAVAELTRGRCDVVIAGGVHLCHDVTLWSVFSQLRALSPSQQIRPFDRGADGILIGEGIGMVILTRLADAERQGDRVYAVIRGTGVASDGRDSSLMRPRVEGQVLALERAWGGAGLDPTAPGAVALVEAHGTATPVGDQAELTTLDRVFGSHGPAIGLGTVKSMIGHAMPAAGMAGLIKAALAVHHRLLPPTLHCEDPHQSLAGTRFRPVTVAAEWGGSDDGGPRRAAVNAFGFGGINAHLILEEAPDSRASAAPAPAPARRLDVRRPWPGPAADSPFGPARRTGATERAPARAADSPFAPCRGTGVTQRVLLLAATSAQDLARQLSVDDGVLLARNDLASAPASGPWRLAIVDPNPTRLELARKVVERGRPWRGRNDLWFTSTPLLVDGSAKVAFLFPGIEQTFDPNVDGVAAHFGLRDPPRGDISTLGGHGKATVALGRLLDAALRRLGIQPDLVAGHSIGEWSAMIAGGMHDGADVDRVFASFDEDSLDVPGVVFAALGCGAEVAEAAIAGLPRTVVSHDNCPHQSIICGDEASVAVALERLRAEGVMGQVLEFRSGFHSPMVEPYLASLGDRLHGLPMKPADVPIWSATTVSPYPDDLDQVRSLAVRHLLEPVRFGPLVRALHDAGVRAFIQVGSGSLTGFVDDTLRDRDQVVISATTAKNGGLDQLLRVAAAVWVEGRTPALAALGSEPGRSAMALRLGSEIVRFAEDVTPLVATPAPSPRPPGDDPLLREFDTLLADAASAADEVLRAWSAAPAAPLPSDEAVLGAAAAPPTAPAASTTTTTTTVVSLETMPYLADHCFYRQAEGWPDLADRFPVVPMTTMLELMIDAARPLAAGRAIVGLSKVRALRWLAATEPVHLNITTSTDGEGNIDVVLDGYARGKVLVADRYPAAPAARAEPLRGQRPSPVAAADLYRDRWLFHGPAFQGVTEIAAFGDDGIRGQLLSLDAPGGLLDNAGQLLGVWVQLSVAIDKMAFPAAIERIEFFGPQPAAGESLGCTVWVRSVADTSVSADLEVRNPDGAPWARITGWTDRRFFTDARVDPILKWPETNRIADEQPGGWFLLRDRWTDPANRELIMRRYLDGTERQHYERQGPRGRHRWLLGRIAAKDALRQRQWDRGAGPLFPAQYVIDNDDAGRPTVRGPGEAAAVSIAHAGDVAVALVTAAGTAAGIDVEAIEERAPQLESLACTPAEHTLLDRVGGSRLEWLTRFWSAKEAVAKAVGTGLAGRPQRFEVHEVDGSRLLVAAVDHGSHWWVDTAILGSEIVAGPKRYVVAWTSTPAAPATAASATTATFSPLPPETERITNGR